MSYSTSGSRGPHLDQNSAGIHLQFLSLFHGLFKLRQWDSLSSIEGTWLCHWLDSSLHSAAGNTYAFVHFCIYANRHLSVCMWLQVITSVHLCVGRYACRGDGRCECTCLCGCAMSKWRMVNEKQSVLYVLDTPPVGVKFGISIPWVL